MTVQKYKNKVAVIYVQKNQTTKRWIYQTNLLLMYGINIKTSKRHIFCGATYKIKKNHPKVEKGFQTFFSFVVPSFIWWSVSKEKKLRCFSKLMSYYWKNGFSTLIYINIMPIYTYIYIYIYFHIYIYIHIYIFSVKTTTLYKE